MKFDKKLKLIIALVFCIWGISFIRNIFLEYSYPTKYEEYVYKYSKEYKIDPMLVFSIIREESKFFPYARSRKDAKGLMQISNITKEWAFKELKMDNCNIYDPKTNIKIGTWYLSRLIKEFDNQEFAIIAYNCGSGNLRSWMDKNYIVKDKEYKIPYIETKFYLKKVKKSYEKYKKLYE